MKAASSSSRKSPSIRGSNSPATRFRRRSRSPRCTTSPTRNASSPIPCSRTWWWPAFPRTINPRFLPMRYLPLSDTDRSEMLARTGVSTIDDLFADIPETLLLKEPVDLPRRKDELEVERILSRMSSRNVSASSVPFFVGAGAYKHHVPATVDHLIQRSEFLTSYTPYQPEIAQGTLQYLFEFQTQVAALTGMEVANASMYDGSTAAAEAVFMAHRVTKRNKAVLSGGLHPHYRAVIETLSRYSSHEVVGLAPDVTASEDMLAAIDDTVSCVVA